MSEQIQKKFIDANSLLEDSWRLAIKIYEDGFRPDHIVALWRGGTPIGAAVHEMFEYLGHKCNHLAVKAKSYNGIADHGEVVLPYIGTFLDELKTQSNPKILLIDDVCDTARTLKKMKTVLSEYSNDVRTGTVHYKPHNNETDLKLDYYVEIVNEWIIYPHEIVGCTPEEIAMKNNVLPELLSRVKK